MGLVPASTKTDNYKYPQRICIEPSIAHSFLPPSHPQVENGFRGRWRLLVICHRCRGGWKGLLQLSVLTATLSVACRLTTHRREFKGKLGELDHTYMTEQKPELPFFSLLCILLQVRFDLPGQSLILTHLSSCIICWAKKMVVEQEASLRWWWKVLTWQFPRVLR